MHAVPPGGRVFQHLQHPGLPRVRPRPRLPLLSHSHLPNRVLPHGLRVSPPPACSRVHIPCLSVNLSFTHLPGFFLLTGLGSSFTKVVSYFIIIVLAFSSCSSLFSRTPPSPPSPRVRGLPPAQRPLHSLHHVCARLHHRHHQRLRLRHGCSLAPSSPPAPSRLSLPARGRVSSPHVHRVQRHLLRHPHLGSQGRRDDAHGREHSAIRSCYTILSPRMESTPPSRWESTLSC